MSRGDSFRRKRNEEGGKSKSRAYADLKLSACLSRALDSDDNKSPSPYPISGSDSARESRSESVSSSEESRREAASATANPSTSHKTYKVRLGALSLFGWVHHHAVLQICVVGDTATGKSSLIGQLITSEYKNAFADEIRELNLNFIQRPLRLKLLIPEDYENTVSICIGGQELDLIFFESDMVSHLHFFAVPILSQKSGAYRLCSFFSYIARRAHY